MPRLTPARTLRRLAAVAAIVVVLAAALFWWHRHEGAAHRHGDAAAATALVLDPQGRKWATDAPLRQGMQRIQALVAALARTDAAHALAPEQAAALAAGVREQVDEMVRNCKLEPQADAVLHVLIADLLSGADALSRPDAAAEGLMRIQRALEHYPRYFEHPGWQTPAGH